MSSLTALDAIYCVIILAGIIGSLKTTSQQVAVSFASLKCFSQKLCYELVTHVAIDCRRLSNPAALPGGPAHAYHSDQSNILVSDYLAGPPSFSVDVTAAYQLLATRICGSSSSISSGRTAETPLARSLMAIREPLDLSRK